MEKKTDMVRRALAQGDLKKALRIAKDFRINITGQQRDKMAKAYECIVHPDFYRQLGYNIQETIEEGKNIVEELYGPEGNVA